jgi:hypothetical protein
MKTERVGIGKKSQKPMEFRPKLSLTMSRETKENSPKARYKANQTAFRWMMNQWAPTKA